jgi:antitoxin component YwqK of YwqJK toxin-antitoxin module
MTDINCRPIYKLTECGSRPLVIANTNGDGILHGVYKRYYPNGVLMVKCNFNNGLLDGEYFGFYKNGGTKRKLIFINGELNGPATFYHLGEKIKTICYFNSNKFNGTLRTFDINGNLLISKTYNYNILESSTGIAEEA